MAHNACWTLSTSVTMDRRLHNVISKGDLSQVLHLVNSGASVNCYVDGLTPMARAITSGQPLIAKSLLDHKPDVHQGRRLFFGGRLVQHEPLLILAVLYNSPDLVKSLIQMGADVNATDTHYNQCALHTAVRKGFSEIMNILLENGGNVNRVDGDSNSALHMAVETDQLDMTKTLVNADAVVNLPGKQDVLPLHIACEHGSYDIAKFLLESGSMVNSKDAFHAMPIHYASKGGHKDIVKELLSYSSSCSESDDRSQTPLHKACYEGHSEVVRILVMQGRADPNQESGEGCVRRLPIQVAAAQGHKEVVSTLMELEADMNLCDTTHGENALNWAIRKQHEEIVDLLLTAGVSPHVVNTTDGSSSLHVACLFDSLYDNGNSSAIVEKLLQKGVDVNVPDHRRMETPLHVLARRGCWQTMEVLLRAPSININQLDDSHLTPLRSAIYHEETISAKILIAHGADINHHPSNKSPCLHAAISRSLYQIAVELVQHGADVVMLDRYGSTPLATLCRDATMVTRLAKFDSTDAAYQLLNILLVAGAKVDETGNGALVTRTFLATDKRLFDLVMSNSVGTPPTLQRLVVACLRKRLIDIDNGSSIWPLIYKLHIPSALKDELCLKLSV